MCQVGPQRTHLLAAPSKVQKPSHRAALPFAEIGAFFKVLREAKVTSARATEFIMLTACRTNEVGISCQPSFDTFEHNYDNLQYLKYRLIDLKWRLLTTT